MKKYEFQKFLRSITNLSNWGYKYIGGNDEYTYNGWQRRTADYTFYAVDSVGNLTELCSGRTNKDHYENEQSLTKKYSNWAKQVKRELNL